MSKLKNEVAISVCPQTLSVYTHAQAIKKGKQYHLSFTIPYKKKTKENIDFVLKEIKSKRILESSEYIKDDSVFGLYGVWLENQYDDYVLLDINDSYIDIHIYTADSNSLSRYRYIYKSIENQFAKELMNVVPVDMTYFVSAQFSGELNLKLVKDYKKYISLNNYSENTVDKLIKLEKMLKVGKYLGKIILLEGPPGTGKTYYIRRLVSMLVQEKLFSRLYYFLGDGVERLNLSDCFRKNILIFEDCDFILGDNGKRSRDLSKLLNLSSGFVDVQSLFIFTSNLPIKEVDDAFTRNGRLIARINFDMFDTSQAIEWLKHNNYDKEIVLSQKEPSLADLYTMLAETRKIDDWQKTEVGFRSDQPEQPGQLEISKKEEAEVPKHY
jgi:hypothetical protein